MVRFKLDSILVGRLLRALWSALCRGLLSGIAVGSVWYDIAMSWECDVRSSFWSNSDL